MLCNFNLIIDRFYNICTFKKRDKEFVCLRFIEGRNIGIYNILVNFLLFFENLFIYKVYVYIVVFENFYYVII